MTLIGLGGTAHIDLASVGKRQANVHFIRGAGAMVSVWRLDEDVASGHATKALLELSDMSRD